MSAATPFTASRASSLALSTRRLSEFEASKEISRVGASRQDVSSTVESVAKLALKVPGVRRVQITYLDVPGRTTPEPQVWGYTGDAASVAWAVAAITAGGQSWGELRLYFDLQPSAIESPLRFGRFLAQQIGLQLNRKMLDEKADSLKEQVERLRKIVEKRKAIQRARAIIANSESVNDAEALLLMRRYSRESRRTLHQVAEALIFGDAAKWTRPRYIPRKPSFRVLAGRLTGSDS